MMGLKEFRGMKKEIKIYIIIISITAVSLGFSHSIISNYLKDVYDVTAFQRGIIEFPRELPGILTILVLGALSFLHDIRVAIVAQILGFIGVMALGLLTPSFSIMLVFLFINSMGMHLFKPLSDSIAMSLVEDENLGKRMGQFKGIYTMFTMVAALIIFAGFRTNIFDFTTKIKWPFILSGGLSLVAIGFLIYLHKISHIPSTPKQKMKYVYRKEYKLYYMLVILFGVQKQIMLVYGPWVLIELLDKKADTLAMLAIIGSFIGIFFIPTLGRWLDKYGVKKLLYLDGISFVVVYLLFGILTAGYVSGYIPTAGLAVFLAYAMIVVDKMSTQMTFIRTVY
ncbi:MAG: MFS transporter, partial [Acidaminobacteraceae bacterium]